MVIEDPYAVASYATEFDKLWEEFTSQCALSTHAAAVRIQRIIRGRKSKQTRSAGTDAQSTPASSALEAHFAAMVDQALAQLTPGAELSLADAKSIIMRLNPKPREASLLRAVVLRRTAAAFDTNVARSTAFVKAASSFIAAIEASLLQLPTHKNALFFPSSASHAQLLTYISRAKSTIELAIFSITDDRIRDALIGAHARGVKVRVISDDETANNDGADVFALAEAGIETVVDSRLAPKRAGDEGKRHMHNKFLVLDHSLLLTGSFNFTYAAASKNCENLFATSDTYFVQRYSAEYEKLWASFQKSTFSGQSRQEAAVTIQKICRARHAKAHVTAKGPTPKVGAPAWGQQSAPTLDSSAFPALS